MSFFLGVGVGGAVSVFCLCAHDKSLLCIGQIGDGTRFCTCTTLEADTGQCNVKAATIVGSHLLASILTCLYLSFDLTHHDRSNSCFHTLFL